MYLLDTNIILEIFLDQEKADVAEEILTKIPSEHLFFSEFSLYTIGIIFIHRKMFNEFKNIIENILRNINLIRLNLYDILDLIHASKRYKLDFDDSYQYVAAKKYGLTLVSFDSDFDHTDIGRKTPEEILEGLQS